jgi:ssRNA-specific RNase YbeY (16S rRNA maturation enzyme)
MGFWKVQAVRGAMHLMGFRDAIGTQEAMNAAERRRKILRRWGIKGASHSSRNTGESTTRSSRECQ